MFKEIQIRKIIEYLLISSLGLIPFVPVMKSLDLIGPQFLYLSVVQVFTAIYLLLNKKYLIGSNTLSKQKLFYSIFIFISFISIFISINFNESVIEFVRHFILYISFLNLTLLLSLNKKYLQFVFLILIVLHAIETLYVFNVFIQNFSFENGLTRIRELQGLSSNQNVGAFSLCIKTPILLIGLLYTKNKFYKTSLFLVLAITFFDISVIGSRGAILGLYLVIFSIIFFIISSKVLKWKYSPTIFSKLYLVLSIFVITTVSQTLLYQNQKDLQIINRSTNYAENDDSINKRKRYYEQAIRHMLTVPIIGSGIGTWKILSVKYDQNKITGYQVPYHAHNDFLQIGAEIGIIGAIVYFFIFFGTIIFLLKKIYRSNLNENKFFVFYFLVVAIMIYIMDASINFPRARPYSQINILYILGISHVLIGDKKINLKIKKTIQVSFILLFSFFSTIISYKLFKVLQEQVYLYYDYNNNRANLQTPKEMVYNFEDEFPNLTNTVIPIKMVKANYYTQNNEIDKAKKLIREGNQYNPYLGIAEFQLSEIYWNEKKFDSANFYAKIAYEKLPNNTSHISNYQRSLGFTNGKKEAIKIFNRTKNLKDLTLWSNHALLITNIKDKNSIEFTTEDIAFVEEAIVLFPDNKWIKAADKIAKAGFKLISEANVHDQTASYFYSKKQFKEAIESWRKAIEIIPNEDSYYLNIAQTYYQMGKMDKALNNLRKIEKLGIKEKKGKFEFLIASVLYELKQFKLACQYAVKSDKLGNSNGKKLKKILSCF